MQLLSLILGDKTFSILIIGFFLMYLFYCRPLFVLKNCLPVTIHFTVGEVQGFIEPGNYNFFLI